MDIIPGGLRFLLRTLTRSAAFSLVVIVTVAVAIGATATILGVVNATIVRPLPFRDAGRLVVAEGWELRERSPRGVSYLEAMDWRAMSNTFDGLAAYDQVSLNMADAGGEPVRTIAEIVTGDFFRILGVNAARGRVFLDEEHRAPDAHAVALVSDDLWRTRFGASEAIVGSTITLNEQPFTIVGVMPPGFRGLTFDTEVWIPMMMVSTIRPASILDSRSNRWLSVVARIEPDDSLDEARRDLERVTTVLSTEYPETNRDRGARVTSLRDFYLGTTRNLVLALFAAVGLLLVIACVNVVSLQLARAAARRREMALRIALGASRGRLVRQLLSEGIVFATAGAALGVLLATWGIDVLLALAPAGLLPAYASPAIDGWVIACTVLIAFVAGVTFGIAPALTRPHVDLLTDLKEGAPSVATGIGSVRRVRTQQLLVIGEVALALVLLSGAALMFQSLRRQLDVNPGFRSEGVFAARLALPRETYSVERRVRFAEQLQERLLALPGVAGAAVGAGLPLRGIESGGYLTFEGGVDEVPYFRHRVSPSYFETLDIGVRSGRAFTAADGPDAPRVAIVSAHMARRLWPDSEAVGRRIRLSGASGNLPWIEVVGVVDDVRFRDLTADLFDPLARVDVYFPFAQQTDETIEVALRSESNDAALGADLRRAVRALDPSLPLYEMAPLSDAVEQQMAPVKFGTFMLSLFGVMAIVLAAVGIYGLLAFVVGTSRREIAIRMALGAEAATVVRMIVRKGMTLVVVGGFLGILITVPSSRALASLLFEARLSDPVVLAGVSTLLLSASLIACWIPARRASRIAPQTALKDE